LQTNRRLFPRSTESFGVEDFESSLRAPTISGQ
jgi:hypothetical protein